MIAKEKRNIFILLSIILAFMLAGICFEWTLKTNIFWYLFAMIIFFPKLIFKILFPWSMFFSVLTVVFVVASKNQWASVVSFWLFYIFVLLVWSLIVRFFKKNE
ncbi:MAG: hypothetical protein ACD_7C00348G0006 [uncultured bacterium]|nr:MAG: hypothetical protein ACD_7C00348G0006 [uncultured bacterium]